jgi:hypothetical protein
LRHLIYLAGVILAFLAAVGVGAMVALVLNEHAERVASNASSSAESSTLLATMSETGGSTKSSVEDTGLKTTNNAKRANNPKESASAVSFIHRATNMNSRGDYTYISDPRINGDSKAIVLATPTSDRKYKHNIGVWYEGANKKKWAIFNQDRTAVPNGASFEVVVPLASQSFIHHAEPDNTLGNITYLDDPLANGRPDAVLSVTQNWNPGGGGGGVYNNHPIDVVYDKRVEQWAIYNQDSRRIPNGAAFNVAISGSE